MGAVTTPFWMLVFRSEDTPVDIASLPTERRKGESGQDAMQRLVGHQDVIEKLDYYVQNVAPIEDDDELHVYKIGDGQRKTPVALSVESFRRRYDVDLTTLFQD